MAMRMGHPSGWLDPARYGCQYGPDQCWAVDNWNFHLSARAFATPLRLPQVRCLDEGKHLTQRTNDSAELLCPPTQPRRLTWTDQPPRVSMMGADISSLGVLHGFYPISRGTPLSAFPRVCVWTPHAPSRCRLVHQASLSGRSSPLTWSSERKRANAHCRLDLTEVVVIEPWTAAPPKQVRSWNSTSPIAVVPAVRRHALVIQPNLAIGGSWSSHTAPQQHALCWHQLVGRASSLRVDQTPAIWAMLLTVCSAL
mmetsp:Transcript_21669/g.50662  ORF Transcript_21669/g.50662 Transcript_21669/m.50662 type:complete len:254 (+) Transcript_21669:428-1189(+)